LEHACRHNLIFDVGGHKQAKAHNWVLIFLVTNRQNIFGGHKQAKAHNRFFLLVVISRQNIIGHKQAKTQ